MKKKSPFGETHLLKNNIEDAGRQKEMRDATETLKECEGQPATALDPPLQHSTCLTQEPGTGHREAQAAHLMSGQLAQGCALPHLAGFQGWGSHGQPAPACRSQEGTRDGGKKKRREGKEN